MFNRRDQESNESVYAYVTALRKLAKTCNYGSLADSLIRDRMVEGINDNSGRKKILQTCKLTLGQCRSSQTSARQLKEMNQEDVRFVKDDRKKETGDEKKTKSPEKSQNESQERKCKCCSRYSRSSRKRTPSGREKSVRNWSWPLTRMVLVSGH